MPPGIGASGIMGVAVETVSGTYQAPTIYVPFMKENLMFNQQTNWRRPIRQTAGIVGAVAGNADVTGSIEMEALCDMIPVFLKAARLTLVKTGSGPYVYTFTPNSSGITSTTLSVTIVRNGIVFGYTGVTVGQYAFVVDDNGTMMFNMDLSAMNEAVQSAPTPTWPTSVPPGAGQYTIEIPTATQVFDCDGLEFTCNDNADPQHRLKNTNRGPQFTKFGEREVTIKTARDFDSRAEYDAYKNLTAQALTIKATVDASNIITIVGNSAIKDTYEVGLDGQGELVRAQCTYQCVDNASGVSHTIAITSAVNIT